MFQDYRYRFQSISPVDFLTLGIIPSVIGDANLIKTPSFLSEFDCYFRLKTEVGFFQSDGIKRLFPEGLIASFHIGQVQISGNVGQQSQKPVAYVMPEKHHPVRVRTDKT